MTATRDDVRPAATPEPPAPPAAKKRTWLRVLAWVAAVLVALLVLLAGVFIWLTGRAFPQTSGTISVPGLGGDVQVVRDGYGIPQIYADTPQDLFLAQGYVHAQDRFWEMDFRRHVTSGRLSELFGKDEVETDRFIRTLGWGRTAEQEAAALSGDAKTVLESYAKGVNAYLAGRSPGRVSMEYSVLGLTNRDYRIEPWTTADSLAWLKYMAWDLKGNYDDELARAVLIPTIGAARTAQLYPPYPFDRHQPVVTNGAVVAGAFDPAASPQPVPAALQSGVVPALFQGIRSATDALPAVLQGGAGIGSNNWVVAGSRTATGKPILSNDPHLAPLMPSIWYQAGLHCRTVSQQCPYDVAGFTFSGVPGIVIGHNGRIAWGVTNVGPDTTDFFLEKVQGDSVERDGRQVPLTTRQETIKVAGGDPVTITVRESSHGPLLSDASTDLKGVADQAGSGYAVAFQWTAGRPNTTVNALLRLNVAKSWDDFRAAAAQWDVPAQNLIYADVDGNIGYQMPGAVPIRGQGDGKTPAPGWDSAYDWKGFIPFASLPYAYNPPEGFVATANNAVVDTRTYPYRITDDWSYGARSQRIVDRIKGWSGPLTVADMSTIQADTRNELASWLAPRLRNVPGLTGAAASGQALLPGWDYSQGRDSAPAMYFNAVWRQLMARVYDDEIPKEVRTSGADRFWESFRALWDRPDDPWWDDTATPQKEDRDATVKAAMQAAGDDLAQRLGNDPAGWRWGDLHTLTITNPTLGKSGIAPIEWIFNRGPLKLAGGEDAVDAVGWDTSSTEANPYQVDWVPSMRMTVDMSDLDASRWVHLTGASGHTMNAHYWDQAPLWANGETLPWAFSRQAVDAAAVDRLTLQPASG